MSLFTQHFPARFEHPHLVLEMGFANSITQKDYATLRVGATNAYSKATEEMRETGFTFVFQHKKFWARRRWKQIEVEYVGPANPLFRVNRKR